MNKYNKIVIMSSATLILDRVPAALAFLAGICEHNQIEYEIFDLNLFLRQTYKDIVWKKMEDASANMEFVFNGDAILMQQVEEATLLAVQVVLSHDPDLVAISLLSSMQIAWADKFLTVLKQQSDVTVIAGGPGISYEQVNGKTAGRLMTDKHILDYFVLGEGDWAFHNFLNGQIDVGVNSKDSNDSWVPQIDDLSNLIISSYKKINLSDYGHANDTTKIRLPPTINLTGSRGCIRRCTFCDIGHLWKKYRFRPAKHMISEMVKHYEETGCINYFFHDSLINGSLKQFTELMEELIILQETYPDFKNLKYSGQFIIRSKSHHQESLYELMQKSGCDHIQVGVESGSETVREHMGKKFTNDDLDYHFEMSSKYRIKNFLFIFPSYPTETLKDFQDTIDFYIKNQKYLIDDTIIGTNVNSPAIIYKNTPLASDEMVEELGIVLHNSQYTNGSNWVVNSNPTLTIKERYRRYIELSVITSELRYPKGTSHLTYLESNITDIKSEISHQMSKKEKA